MKLVGAAGTASGETIRRRLFRLVFLVWFSLTVVAAGAAERILVLAPHPDDEVISLGGYLADRTAAGAEVWVAVITDGEAYARAVRMNRRREPSFLLRARDFRRLGKRRRLESESALAILGVPAERTWFLGYPNGLLRRLFQAVSPDQIFRSPATGQRFGIAGLGGVKRSPHPFSRRSLGADLDELLAASRPDVILTPHPWDTHTDHQAVTRFLFERLRLGAARPKVWGYLVHWHGKQNFPRPYGYHPLGTLVAPSELGEAHRYSLTPRAREIKEQALRAHRSQIRLRDGFLLSFVRRDELYWPLNELLEQAQLHPLPFAMSRRPARAWPQIGVPGGKP